MERSLQELTKALADKDAMRRKLQVRACVCGWGGRALVPACRGSRRGALAATKCDRLPSRVIQNAQGGQPQLGASRRSMV